MDEPIINTAKPEDTIGYARCMYCHNKYPMTMKYQNNHICPTCLYNMNEETVTSVR